MTNGKTGELGIPQLQPGFLNAFTLKVIAITAMTLDHIGAFLYPDDLWLRVIGRLTIPIIAFLIVEGYYHTSGIKRYMLRLLVFAVLAQPVYLMAFGNGLNVLFDLLTGLSAILIIDRYKLGWWRYPFIAIVSLIAIAISLDWWHLAILLIYIFHEWRGNFKALTFAIATLFILNFLLFKWLADSTGNASLQITHATNLWCIATLPLIYFYNGARGKFKGLDYRYFFYLYYPAHLIIIYLIKINYY